MAYNKKQIEIANKTSRSKGAVGKKAVVPHLVRNAAYGCKVNILDYGAGKEAYHAKELKKEGYDVTAYDFGDNVIEGLHDKKALDKKYTIVYASNVLNVQSSKDMLKQTIKEVRKCVKKGGMFICNLPVSPRKFKDLTPELVNGILEKNFRRVYIFKGTLAKSSSPVFWCLA